MIDQQQIDTILAGVDSERVIERIWQKDGSVWPIPTTPLRHALGWLHVMDELLAKVETITTLVAEVCAENYSHVVLIGMGGASMASEVLRSVFGVKQGFLDLIVLESNAPLSVLQYTEQLDANRTLFIICSKSGYTVETVSLFRYFYNWVSEATSQEIAGNHFIAITDPGSETEALARSLHFRAIFLNNPEVGGHYSALSYFGMVPAAMAGIDIVKLLQSGSEAAKECQQSLANSPSAQLAAQITSHVRAGQNKITFITSAALTDLGVWLEQLIAGSLGKSGITLFPVEGEALLKPKYYRQDRLFIYLRMVGDSARDAAIEQLRSAGQPVIQIDITHLTDLGSEFFRWQMACAIVSHLLGINPFDQPNVDASKAAVENVLRSGQYILPEESDILQLEVQNEAEVRVELKKFLRQVATDEETLDLPYVALLAFLPPTPEIEEALDELRTQIQRRTRLATSIGYSPRFLHSTAEMYLGDGGLGLFIQLTANHAIDVAIPSVSEPAAPPFSFGKLLDAQANTNWQLLTQRKRAVIRFHMGDEITEGIQILIDLLREWAS